MRFNYYPETDSLYIDLSEKASVDSREVVPCVVLDFDAEGHLVGIDIDHASQIANLSHLETKAIPITNLEMTAHRMHKMIKSTLR